MKKEQVKARSETVLSAMAEAKTNEVITVAPGDLSLPHFSQELAVPLSPDSFKTLKRMTLDATSISRLGQAIILCNSELYEINMVDPANPGKLRPVPVVNVLDCIRQEEFMLICSAVMASTFKRYNGALAGHYFAIRAGDIVAGKHYRKVDIVEVELVK